MPSSPSSACWRSSRATRARRWTWRAPTTRQDRSISPRRRSSSCRPPIRPRRPRSPSIATSRRCGHGACSPRRDGAAGVSSPSDTTRTSRACRATSVPPRRSRSTSSGSSQRATPSSARRPIPRARSAANITTPSAAAGAGSGAAKRAGAITFARPTSTSRRAKSTAVRRSTRATTSTGSRPPMRRTTRRARPPATRNPRTTGGSAA